VRVDEQSKATENLYGKVCGIKVFRAHLENFGQKYPSHL